MLLKKCGRSAYELLKFIERSPRVASTLLMLELKGTVRQVGTMSFVPAH